jgi:hypothetical protein
MTIYKLNSFSRDFIAFHGFRFSISEVLTKGTAFSIKKLPFFELANPDAGGAWADGARRCFLNENGIIAGGENNGGGAAATAYWIGWANGNARGNVGACSGIEGA